MKNYKLAIQIAKIAETWSLSRAKQRAGAGDKEQFFGVASTAEYESEGGEEDSGDGKEANGDEVARAPSERPPLDLHARALHPLRALLWLLGEVEVGALHPQLLHAPRECPPVLALPLKPTRYPPVGAHGGLHRAGHRQRGGQGEAAREPPAAAGGAGDGGVEEEREGEAVEGEEEAGEAEDGALGGVHAGLEGRGAATV